MFPVDSAKPTNVEIDFLAAENVDLSEAPLATKGIRCAVLALAARTFSAQLAASPDGVFFAGALLGRESARPEAGALPARQYRSFRKKMASPGSDDVLHRLNGKVPGRAAGSGHLGQL